MLPTVVLDFDGTLALGPGPALAYARRVAAAVADPRLLVQARTAVERAAVGDEAFWDGYDAVRQVALAHAVPESVLTDAYLASRDDLGTDAAPVSGPPGLADFLAALRSHARLVLATNAPPTGVERVLDAIGAAPHLAERHFAVGKPAGLAAVVAHHLTAGPVLSVGDVWAYDLEPARALGADTALVGPTAAHAAVPATLRGPSLAALYGDLHSWAATAAEGPSAPADVDPLDRKA
ncbi:HAD family hydrolase [Xylanimonas ulmi]|uniref:FMN phosphatase YigB (HAD superfamily) n=1 Tax=Xylanimonas ulmi TaxID=228973 RepID=A0A4Q7M2H6_9MICO|nr:HAD family hydrolase [Xylanibacterium ulmi]RZS60802.1 FMN phosphatase YigB (HAD superfamily) [Xylanibacterium ulmi]